MSWRAFTKCCDASLTMISIRGSTAQQEAWSRHPRPSSGPERNHFNLVERPTEGQITKLKLIKRQMYGRGKLDFLEARIVGAP